MSARINHYGMTLEDMSRDDAYEQYAARRDQHNKGKAMAADLEKVVNYGPHADVFFDGLAEGIRQMHPTLQQSFMRAFMRHIVALLAVNTFVDARNLDTQQFCKRIMELCEEENIHFHKV